MHDPALRERAKELRKGGTYIRVIAADLGVSKPTVTRWLNPELEKRERVKARKRKYGNGSKCPRCKRKKTAVSKHCWRCARELQTTHRPWPRERIIEAIQQWAIEKGHAPTHGEWQKSGRDHPAISSICRGPNRQFSSWSEALTEAGFTPRKHRSGKTKYAPGEKAALRRQLREQRIIKALQKENDDARVPESVPS